MLDFLKCKYFYLAFLFPRLFFLILIQDAKHCKVLYWVMQ